MNGKAVRILGLLITILVILGGVAGIFIWYLDVFQHQNVKTEPRAFIFPHATVYSQNAPPTPGTTLTTYTNSKYGYRFMYPHKWQLHMSSFQGVDTVQGLYQVRAGDNYPFEINCQQNPDGLDAQTWFNQKGHGTGIGYINLKSGIAAYLSVGHGQVDYKTYTLVHNHIICSLGITIANDANNSLTDNIINSFIWQ